VDVDKRIILKWTLKETAPVNGKWIELTDNLAQWLVYVIAVIK
jgi:hypothetical protein